MNIRYWVMILSMALTMGVAAASASVLYSFTAESSFPFNGDQFTGSFYFISPTYVTNTENIFPASFQSFSVASTGSGASGVFGGFLPNYSGGGSNLYDAVTLGVVDNNNPSARGINYYFQAGAFDAPGTYQTVVFGSQQAGTLVVSVVPLPGALPLFASAIIGIGAVARRRMRRQAA